ncbi:uncharacterized protein V6R79_026366 [Siganus canaliculatus]
MKHSSSVMREGPMFTVSGQILSKHETSSDALMNRGSVNTSEKMQTGGNNMKLSSYTSRFSMNTFVMKRCVILSMTMMILLINSPAHMLFAAGLRAEIYDNTLGGTLFRQCPGSQVVSRVRSSHKSTENDRQWKFECKTLDARTNCAWSGFHNLNEKELSFNCPANRVISGVASLYGNGDRRWNFLCCSAPNLITFECQDTPKINYFNEDFDWHVPGDNFLTGVHTHGKNNDGDHRWSFSYCRGTQEPPSEVLAAEPPPGTYLEEGDIVLPKRTKRSAKVCRSCRWPKSGQMVQVPYTINDAFSYREKSKINEAMQTFHLETCVRFVPRTGQNNYINIQKGRGCSSFVGRFVGGSQSLSLASGCVYTGIIQHELIHALGFWHEQSRTDRDIYVKINYENIKDRKQHNFKKHETNNLNVPYDYSSVMHYRATAFSKNGQETITPLTLSVQLGQRIGMTENDIFKVNKLYNCKNYLHKYDDWDNELTGVLRRNCPSGQAVAGIISVHKNDKNDRLFGISCKAFTTSTTCRWSGYANNYCGNLNFACPRNHVITGVYSKYCSLYQDRKFKFKCCRANGFTTFNCKTTPKINYWDEYFNWKVPSSNFLTGVRHSFSSRTRDRRWSFLYCQKQTQ